MKKIRVGLVGCGFVSELHMYAYRRVYGVDVEVKAVAARGDHVVEFAKKHGIPTAYRSFAELVADREHRRHRHLHAAQPARRDDRGTPCRPAST